uniref:Lipase (Class 3) n=1 Tax=Candidatus Kentrum sp. LFY TaxID=2126342 RepID=A0A450UHS5_9GAMM|nr:MAG: Lipase (class 3) [Candidatus Kentron sp. LFY]
MKYYDHFQGIFQTDSYDKKTALSLAIACDLAYEKQSGTISSIVEGWGYKFAGFKSVVKKPDIDTQCFVMFDNDNIVVVFRGSEDLKDWLANFQAVYDPGPFRETKAHEGFQDALFPSVMSLTNLIDSAGPANKRIWVTGHSLGGAQCSLYAGMLIEHGYKVYGIYTYASPRPGNGVFEEKLNSRVIGPHYRVVNTGDVVPHLPPEPFFSHPGKRIILKEESKEDSDASWLEERYEALRKFIKSTANLLDVADNHRLSADDESYIPRLIKDLERSETQEK